MWFLWLVDGQGFFTSVPKAGYYTSDNDLVAYNGTQVSQILLGYGSKEGFRSDLVLHQQFISLSGMSLVQQNLESQLPSGVDGIWCFLLVFLETYWKVKINAAKLRMSNDMIQIWPQTWVTTYYTAIGWNPIVYMYITHGQKLCSLITTKYFLGFE